MEQKLLDDIRGMVRSHKWKRLLLAVSGGLDSICLAHYFIQNREALGIEGLGIAHVHHGLREGTADADAEFVQKFAEAKGVPFFLRKLDGAVLKAGGSVEENARDARYEALAEIACESCAEAIVTAHHAGDQAETLYLRLRRGVTLAGLSGMASARALSVRGKQSAESSEVTAAEIKLYRPLLNVTRERLKEYARENSLCWREDESNADIKFARNLVRHKLLPNLEQFSPGATAQLCRIAGLARTAYKNVLTAVNTLCNTAIIPEAEWPFEASVAPYQKVLALSWDRVASLLANPLKKEEPAENSSVEKGRLELFRLWLDSRGFRFPVEALAMTQAPRPLMRFHTRALEKCRHILWIYDVALPKASTNLYFEGDKSRFSQVEGCWRHPEEGDVLWPLDEKIKQRPLKQWLQEKGIPHWVRPSLDVFAQGHRVVFVSGVRAGKVTV
ncbi:MAG: tRNA lysidine(34) synthetase TilS [Fibrobacter sp.]|nr:tRNA lysidine(34) synthetase TilS [Fibrobacter sp.]